MSQNYAIKNKKEDELSAMLQRKEGRKERKRRCEAIGLFCRAECRIPG